VHAATAINDKRRIDFSLVIDLPQPGLDLTQHSPDEIWNGVDDSRRLGCPATIGALRTDADVLVYEAVRGRR